MATTDSIGGRRVPRDGGPRPRVLLLSADVGEGHVAAARAIGADVEAHAPGAEVVLRNDFGVLGPVLDFVFSRGFRFHIGRVGWSYDLLYRFFMSRAAAPARAVSRRVLRALGGPPLLREIAAVRPDVVVSTYPVLTTVLGELRLAGRLDVPVAARVLEVENFHFIAHPGVDVHLLLHAEALRGVEAIAGAGRAEHVRPPVPAAFLHPPERAEARSRAGLPADGPVVLASGGGWGMGDVAGAAAAALALPGTQVVCLPGRNVALREALGARFAEEPRVRVLGFVDRARMADLLAGADALVHATAGMTVLEARLCGCPAVCYGFPIGHVRANAEAMARDGLARLAETPEELTATLAELLAAGRPERLRVEDLPAPGAVVLELAGALRARR